MVDRKNTVSPAAGNRSAWPITSRLALSSAASYRIGEYHPLPLNGDDRDAVRLGRPVNVHQEAVNPAAHGAFLRQRGGLDVS